MRRILLTLLIAILSVPIAWADETGGATVVRAEYFFDTDPGYGNATIINNVTSGDNNLSLSVEGLLPGAHMLYVRSQASNGVWSSTQSHPLLLIKQKPVQATRVEYFYDTDPGYGNGKSVGNLTDGDNTLVVSVAGLAYGVHHLCLRAQDNTGVWSQVATSSVFVTSPKTANVNCVEYFFDTDPGYGHGTVLVLGGAQDVVIDISTANITPGAHMLYLRAQDNHGRWSSVQSHPIYVMNNLPDVVAVEYFFDDNDPGEGQATAVPLPSVKTDPFAFEANTAGLSAGEHHLKVRLQKNNGFWTLYDAATFTIEGLAEPEPYAVLTDNTDVLSESEAGITYGKTLTFYYDNQKTARNGMDIEPFSKISERDWNVESRNITSVVFDASFANDTTITSTAYWFANMTSLLAIDGIRYLHTQNVTDMKWMFSGCSSLTSLDLGGFNTENVTSMSYMFYSCNLANINVSSFNTQNVTDMSYMFYQCSALTSLDLSSFKGEKLSNIGGMFSQCSSLTSLDLSGFNTQNVTNMAELFNQCTSLISLDLSGFNTENVTSMSQMFSQCSSLPNLDLSSFNPRRVTSMYDMLNGCSALTTIYASSLWTTASVSRSISNTMFSNCTKLVGGMGTVFDTNHIGVEYARIDGGPTSETPGYFTDRNAPVITDPEPYFVLTGDTISGMTLSFYYDGNRTANGGTVIAANGYGAWHESAASITTVVFDPSFAGYLPVSTSSWFNGCKNLTAITGIENLKTDSVKNMSFMFAECEKLETLDVSGFNTETVTTMLAMFQNCKSLTALDVSRFNTAKVTSFAQMFNGCSGLTSIDVIHFITTSATAINSMFNDCSGLTSIDVSKFNTANVTDMGSIFSGCTGLTDIDVSNFDVRNAKDMRSMFYSCTGLTSLDLSNFYTPSAERINFMFMNCTSLTTIDISNITTANVLHMNNMFYNCSSLTTIYAGDFDLTSMEASSSMFYGCTSLVGGKGTVFDASHTDHAYAHIDGGTTNPGYFTDKNATPAIAEAYAVLSDNNTVLTFYYDTEKQARGGMDVGPFSAWSARGWHEQCESIKNVVFDASFANDTTLTSTAHWFYGCRNMTTITGISNLRTDNVRYMRYMFRYCTNLTELDVREFNTENVENMRGMFSHCSSLTSLDVSGFKTDNVTDMMSMFDGCTKLTSIDVSRFNTEKVTNLSVMFQMCSSLTSLDLSNFNTSNVTNTQGMFYGCSNLVYLDVRNFDMSKVNNEEKNMFTACSSLASIIAGNAEILAEEYARIGNPNLLVYVNEPSLAPQGVQNVVVNGLAKDIVLTDDVGTNDNNNFFVPQSFTAEKITYTRIFTQQTQPNVSRGWESISLPFNVQNIVHESKGSLVPFGSSAEGKKFWLRRLADNGLTRAYQIEANVPYVISMPNSTEYTDLYNLAGRVTFSAKNTTVPATTPQTMSLSDGSIDMVSTMLRVNRSSSVWALNVGEVRGQYLEGSVFERDYRMVRPFQAYTVHHSNTPAPRFVPINTLMDGEATSIDELMSPEMTGNSYYTLDGRKLDSKPITKGVYIRNGRKIVIE